MKLDTSSGAARSNQAACTGANLPPKDKLRRLCWNESLFTVTAGYMLHWATSIRCFGALFALPKALEKNEGFLSKKAGGRNNSIAKAQPTRRSRWTLGAHFSLDVLPVRYGIQDAQACKGPDRCQAMGLDILNHWKRHIFTSTGASGTACGHGLKQGGAGARLNPNILTDLQGRGIAVGNQGTNGGNIVGVQQK